MREESEALILKEMMRVKNSNYWVRVFRNGPSKICRRQLLKNLKWYGLPSRTYRFKILKGHLPQILLGPFLNTLTELVPENF